MSIALFFAAAALPQSIGQALDQALPQSIGQALDQEVHDPKNYVDFTVRRGPTNLKVEMPPKITSYYDKRDEEAKARIIHAEGEVKQEDGPIWSVEARIGDEPFDAEAVFAKLKARAMYPSLIKRLSPSQMPMPGMVGIELQDYIVTGKIFPTVARQRVMIKGRFMLKALVVRDRLQLYSDERFFRSIEWRPDLPEAK